MTEVVIDTRRRVHDRTAASAPHVGWFDGASALRLGSVHLSAIVAPLWAVIAALIAIAGIAAVATPSSASSAAAMSATAPAPVAVPAPVELLCSPAHYGTDIAFTAAFGVTGGGPDIVRWQIDYGDGQGATGASAKDLLAHTYRTPGIHMALLSATSAGGTTSTSSCVTYWYWSPAKS